MDYYNKYIKYKQKYLKLKNQDGGILPFVKLDNGTKDYFPFDNNNFNYYLNNHSLILNDEKDKVKVDYLLNEKFVLEPIQLDSEKKTSYKQKNIINNNNIYKLADEQIIISDEIKFPFHLCLLSKYKILDELYLKHINIKDILNKNFSRLNKNEQKNIINIDEPELYKLNKDLNKTYLLKNAKKVFTNIFNFHSETNRILNITYNYNILLKYSYCNNFLELLKLIYNIQSKIDYKNFDIITKDIKILFNDENYNLEDYIAIHIINFFISPLLESGSKSLLKNNFDKIYYFYNKYFKQQIKEQREQEQSEQEQSQLEEFNNAIQTYINISDTTLLFKYISTNDVHFRKEKSNELLKNNILKKIQNKDLNKDLQSLKEHLENDINDIKQLLLFNLYVDNEIDISPKFSHIFYTSFINYRINKPLISYEILLNLYPININNFVCNLIGIENNTLVKLINVNEEKSDMSINKKMFISTYIKHPIHSFEGITIRTETYNYKNCVENGILEFIKILFWDQRQFEIKLPDENKKTKTKTFLLLEEIFNDINQNLKNITSFYESPEYNKKIDKLFSGHDNILYKKFESKYEIISNMDNFYKMLCIILNFENEEKLKEYLETINEYNSNITEIIITDELDRLNGLNGLIEIRIEDYKLYTITIQTGHTYLSSFDNINIFDLIKYEYLNLLIYNTNIISNYKENVCEKYIYKYKNELSKNKEDDNFKYYEYIVVLMIINNPELTFDITDDFPNNIEIINKAFEKNPEILFYLNLNKDDIITFFNTILKKISQDHPNNKDILKCIVHVSLLKRIIEYINIDIGNIDHDHFLNIVLKKCELKPHCTLINYIFNKYYNYIRTLLQITEKYQEDPNYKYLAMCILRNYPKFIEKIPVDHSDFPEIIINSFKVEDNINCKIVDYVIKNYDNTIRLLDTINKNFQKHPNYKDLVICILCKSPEFIEKIPVDHPDFPEIIINSFKVEDNINCKIVDYVIKNYDNTIRLLDTINKNFQKHPNYKDLVICILCKSPEFIEKIPVDHPDFPEIVINSIKVKDNINSKIVDYVIKNYDNTIRLLDTINKNFQKHPNYKDLVICILCKSPEFIEKIPVDHPDFPEIVINSINVNDENNCEIVDHIIDNINDTYFDNLQKILLLEKLKNNYASHKNYKKLVRCILNNKKKLFKNIIRNNSDKISKSHIN